MANIGRKHGASLVPSAYLAFIGEPTATSMIPNSEIITYCSSESGSYIIPVSTIAPGKTGAG